MILLLTFGGPVYSGDGDADQKREKLRSAIREGVFRLYDVPLEYYVRLGMWKEIDTVFRNNNEIARSVSLPGLYYSRPYFIRDKMWVFENPIDGKGAIYTIRPDTLEIANKLENPEFTSYEGGVRVIEGDTIVSGGHDTDKDVDAAVVWNTKTQQVNTVKLQNGHYVCSAHIEDDILYIGSCGEVVEAWDFETLEYVGGYLTDPMSRYTSWDDKECITAVAIIGDRLFGVGEKSVFIWDIETAALLDTYEKALHASIDLIHNDLLFSYRGNRFIVRELETAKVLTDQSVDKPIEDLIVVSEKVISEQPGDIMIISLRRNKGFYLYDPENFNLIRRFDFDGRSLAVHQNAIYASGDKTLYRYDVMRAALDDYRDFLDKADLSELNLTDDIYERLMERIAPYPDAVRKLGVAKRFMKAKGLSIDHSFKYVNIGNFPDTEKEAAYGYKAFYDVTNDSDHYYYISMICAWSGAYGADDQEGMDAFDARAESFFIPPDGAKHSGQVVAGEKEPLNIIFYPTKIREVTRDYYEGFKHAASHENRDVDLIDKYLKDDLVKDRHNELMRRKTEIAENSKGFWLFNIFR